MKLTTFIFLVLMPATILSNPNHSDKELFVTLTSGDVETQMMAMVLATQSFNQGVLVRILLCSEAGELALKESNSPSFKPADRSPKQLLNTLIEQGTTFEVCGIFLPNRDYTNDDLIDNIGVASPPEIAAYMNRESVKLFTF